MLKTFKKCVRYTLNGESVAFAGWSSGFSILDESEAVDNSREWHGLEEIKDEVISEESPVLYKYTLLKKYFCLITWDARKLRVRDNSILVKTVSYKQIDISLKDLFSIQDSNKVIEYLKQRGMTVCPMKV